MLTALDFEVELNYDYVTFGSGPNATDESKMYRTTGKETPERFYGRALWIKLETDETVGRKGFFMQAEWVNSSGKAKNLASRPFSSASTNKN